jgi:hypothetical protein
MKTLSKQTIIELAKCSNSTAIEIIYSNLLESKKLYLNKKNNSNATIKWLEKNFDAKFTKGNDAPRAGKTGDFVTFTTNDNFEKLAVLINKKDAELVKQNEAKKTEQQKAVNEMIISETEKVKFLEKTKGLSNKKSREIAHNFAGRKLGFFSNQAKDKFMSLR